MRTSFFQFIQDRKFFSYSWFVYLSVALFLTLVILLTPSKGMSPVWSVPYFSGAALFDFKEGWRFSPADVDRLKEMNGYEIYTYKFNNPTDELWINNLNNSGYLYLTTFSTLLLPFLGPIGAIVLIQLFTHLFICYLITRRIPDKINRLLFLFGYFANPLVIYFVIFPFYYFWQVIPSAAFLFFYLDKSKKLSFLQFSFAIIASLIAFLIRPTVVLMIPALIVFCSWKYKSWTPVASIPFLIFAVVIWNKYYNWTEANGPWHTVYIGIGAYPNPFPELYDLSDDRGFQKYEMLSGKRISTSIEGEYSKNTEVRLKYLNTLKQEIFRIAQKHPFLLIRNAFLNGFQAYSIGYFNKLPFAVHLIVSLSGLIFIFWLIFKKLWLEFFIIGVSHISFTTFYPPIQTYYYGTIILLVIFYSSRLISPGIARFTNSAKNSIQS